ncbi:MAG: hypothetical protein JW765_09815 [Deltaproteobacteria bacterium]|nr:hypothetical protein [Candidatus Zymogenaceae bacterium]
MGTENLDRSAIGAIEVNDGFGWETLGIIREEIIRVNGKEITHLDTSGYPFGVDKTIFGKVDIEIDFIWEEIADIDLWNIVLHGGSITTSAAGTQTVMNEEVIMKGIDWIALTHAADFTFNTPVKVTNEEGSVTYSEGNDYYLDRKGGHLKRITGGSIGDSQMVHVDYTYNTCVGKSFKIFEDSSPIDYSIRLTKPMVSGDYLRISHSKVNFSSEAELPLKPGEGGAWAGVTSKIKFLRDSDGVYGTYGGWEIYTP